MRFTPQFLDELRARLPVSEVVGRRVKLKKAGREWKGLSPFNNEKTPSFTVSEQKGFYHYFGSGKHGNILDFVMETEGVVSRSGRATGRARRHAAAGRGDEKEEAREKTRRARFTMWMELATAFFRGSGDWHGARGKKALAYLEGRALTGAAVGAVSGWALRQLWRSALKDHLTGKSVSLDEMIEAGLLVAPDDGSAPYDRFRGRVIFPIADGRGRIIAFGGRTLDPEGAAEISELARDAALPEERGAVSIWAMRARR